MISDKLGIFGKPFQQKANQAVLTPKGQQKLEASNGSGTQWTILWYLKEHGRSSPKEISDDLSIAFPKVKNILNSLAGKDYRWVEWV